MSDISYLSEVFLEAIITISKNLDIAGLLSVDYETHCKVIYASWVISKPSIFGNAEYITVFCPKLISVLTRN